jgi:hypothetical protein
MRRGASRDNMPKLPGGPVEMGMNAATRTEDHDAGEAQLKMCAVCLLFGK